MEQWQQFINSQLKDKILSELREIRSKTDVYVGMNYKINYPPDGFSPGSEVYIPISAPSDAGPLHIGNAVLSIGPNNEIVGVDYVDAYIRDKDGVPTLDFYCEEPSEERNQQTFTTLLSKVNTFVRKINNVIISRHIQYLLQPKVMDVDGFSLDQTSTYSNSPGRTIKIGEKKQGFSGAPKKWSDIRSSNLEAEMAVVASIKTASEQKNYIINTLSSLRQAPRWYSVLGGKVKDDARQKIIDLYLAACETAGKTLPASMFYEKLRRQMLAQNKLTGFCERDARRVNGTINSECLNKLCSSYRPDCPKFSYRLNTYQ